MTESNSNLPVRQPGQSMFAGLKPSGDMSKPEALTSINQINNKLTAIEGHLSQIRRLVVELNERKGWKALGYTSFRECAEAEFGKSMRTIYNMLTSGIVERNVFPDSENFAESANIHPVIPDVVAKELKTLEPADQKAVYEFAVATAPEGNVTARWAKATRVVYEQAKLTGGYVDIGNGESTALEAAVAQEAHETMLRQKQHIAESTRKKIKIYSGRGFVRDDGLIRPMDDDQPVPFGHYVKITIYEEDEEEDTTI